MNNLIKQKYLIKFLFFLLLFAHLIPILFFKFIPTQDGINHVYNSYLLKEYGNEENYKIREIFKLNLKIFPNWASHAIMATLMYVFPPLICEKIIQLMCVGLFSVSLYCFFIMLNKNHNGLILLAPLFSYNFLYHLGFYNFILSCSMFFFTFAYVVKNKNEIIFFKVLILYIFLFITYLCHFMSFFLLVILLTLYLILLKIKNLFFQLKNKNFINKATFLWGQIRHAFVFLVFIFPLYFSIISYYSKKISNVEIEYKNFHELFDYFIKMEIFTSYWPGQEIVGKILFYFFLIIILYVVYQKLKYSYFYQRFNLKSFLHHFIINENNWYLFFSCFLAFLYFISPNCIGYVEWINDRIYLYVFLIMLPFLAIKFKKNVSKWIIIFIIFISFLNLGFNVYAYYFFNKEFGLIIDDVPKIKEHSTLKINKGLKESSRFGKLKYVNPFKHFFSFFCIKKDVAYYCNYEAFLNWFPVNFSEKALLSNKTDYIFILKSEKIDVKNYYLDDYSLISDGEYYKIYFKDF